MAERGQAVMDELAQMDSLAHYALVDAIKRQDPDAVRAAVWLHAAGGRGGWRGRKGSRVGIGGPRGRRPNHRGRR
ncbi:hypothetical protein B1218_33770 [Pseudomonas ogarae]|nr:hypothetical protein B1218_33770 [Pseudomonas ogarae]